MNDVYKEILIKKKKTSTDTLKTAGLILLVAAVAAAGILVVPVLLPVAVVLIFVVNFLIQNMKLEYEYLYVNGDMDIDKIMNQTRRKKAASFDIANLEMIAPTGSHDLDAYAKKDARHLDFTSGDEHAKSYTAVYSSEKGTQIVKLELDQDILQDMRRLAPRKMSRECFY